MTDMFGWDKEDVEDEESDDNDRSDDEGKMVKKRKKKLKVEDTGKKAGGKIKKFVLDELLSSLLLTHGSVQLVHGWIFSIHELLLLMPELLHSYILTTILRLAIEK